jgi:hypothetical protein
VLALRPKWQHNMKITFSLSVGSEKTRRKGNFHITHVTFSLFFSSAKSTTHGSRAFFRSALESLLGLHLSDRFRATRPALQHPPLRFPSHVAPGKKFGWVKPIISSFFPLCKAPRALHSLSRRSLVINISSSINFSAMELQILALTTRSTYPAFFFA